jgi:hypothetical protein
MAATPDRVSVVIGAPAVTPVLGACLEALREQHEADVEVVGAAAGRGPLLERLEREHPDAVFLPCPAGAQLPELLGAGLARATGPIVAVTDGTTIPGSNWIRTLREAHRADRVIVGGAVMPPTGGSVVDWAAFWCDYGPFMPPMRRAPARVVPGNNVSFRRSALEHGREFATGAFWKTFWCERLRAQGFALVTEPDAVVRDAKTNRLGPLLSERFRNGRCYAAMRSRQVPAAMRVCYAAGSPILPVLLLARTARPALGKRGFRARLLAALPLIALTVGAWSAGEAVGYVVGSRGRAPADRPPTPQ